MATFVFPDRDAYATVRGYFYQIQITIQRWLDLEPSEELQLECGEDIDRVGRVLSESGIDCEARLLEQVRHRAKPVTLRSPEVLAALTAFHSHRVENPQVHLRFRYITNAMVAHEVKSPMPEGVPALEAWERLRSDACTAVEGVALLAGIRSLLSTVTKPSKVGQEGWRRFRKFVGSADDAELLALVYTVEWATGATSFGLIEGKIEEQLVETGRSGSTEESRRLYERLVLFVLQLLSISGPKRLTLKDLESVATRPELSSADSRLLRIIEQLLAGATQGLDDIKELKVLTTDTRQTVRNIAIKLGLRDLKAVVRQLVPVDVPPLVRRLASREANVSRIAHVLENAPYCAIQGEIGSGKTQLAALVCRRLGGRAIWIRVRTFTPEQAGQALDEVIASTSRVRRTALLKAWYSKACRTLGPETIIVLDDMPRVLPNDYLSTRLAILAEVCWEHKLRIISTSFYELPIAVREQMGALVVPARVPSFSDDEIVELFVAHGMPGGLNIRKFIPMLEAVTRRHPMLLAAAARYMASAGWASNWHMLEGILKGVFAVELKPDTQQMLRVTVPDPITRSLLYRLRLASPFFTKEDAASVAQVQPTLDRPLERFNDAVGLWIQEESAKTYSLSPLLGSADLDLAMSTQRAIHLTLADGIMKKRVLGPVEVLEVFTHFALAGNIERAAVLLLMALMSLNELEDVPDDWGLLAIWSHTELPTEVDLTVRILLRAQQCVALLRRGEDAKYLLNDFDSLLTQTGQAEAFAITSGCTSLALHLKDAEPSRANNYLSKALACGPTWTLPGGTQVTIPDDLRLESLLWMTASSARTSDDLRSWLSVLEGLNSDQLRAVFDSEFAEDGCVTLCDGIWVREAAKPQDEQDYTAVLGQLTKVQQSSERLGIIALRVCAVRAKVGVLAECMKDLNGALRLATQGLESLSHDPIGCFLLMEVAGRECVYAERWGDAAKYLTEAVGLGQESYPILRVNALIALSEALSHTVGSAAAVPPCERAVQLARSTQQVPEISLIQALGENAIACWYAGDREAAYRLLEEGVQRLLVSKSDNPTWKKTFVIAGHTCGYFGLIASDGKLPGGITDYLPPKRGTFNSSNPEVAALYDPNREWVLAGQLALFAAALDNDDGAAAWALRAVDVGRITQGGEISGALKPFAITQAILDQRYLDALELAVGALEAIASSVAKPQDQRPAWWPSPPRALSKLDSQEADIVSAEIALMLGLVPIAFGLATAWLNDPERTAEMAATVAKRCSELAQGPKPSQLWSRAADVIVKALASDASAYELSKLGGQVARDSSALQMICYLGALLRARPENALRLQLTIVPFLEKNLKGHGAYKSIVVPFVCQYWENKLRNSGFYFRQPSMTLQLLIGIETKPVRRYVRSLLKLIARSLAYIPDRLESDWLEEQFSTGADSTH